MTGIADGAPSDPGMILGIAKCDLPERRTARVLKDGIQFGRILDLPANSHFGIFRLPLPLPLDIAVSCQLRVLRRLRSMVRCLDPCFNTGELHNSHPDVENAGPGSPQAIHGVWPLYNLGIPLCFQVFCFFQRLSHKSYFDQLDIVYDVPALKVLLPVGISFYTFQTLGYLIDVYRYRLRPETSSGDLCAVCRFFSKTDCRPY